MTSLGLSVQKLEYNKDIFYFDQELKSQHHIISPQGFVFQINIMGVRGGNGS